MRISEFIEHLEQELPRDLAVAGDPVGVQVMPSDDALKAVAVAYELNERIVDVAASAGAGLLVAFHPLIYPSVASITHSDRVGRTIMSLVRHGITLYIAHTAFDAHPDGTSMLLARELGLLETEPLEPSMVVDGAGMGAIGRLPEAMDLDELAERVRAACAAEVVRVSRPAVAAENVSIRRVAILGGSGMSYYDHAVSAGADAFVTGDVRYHAFHAANDHIPVLDPGHAETERFVVPGLTAVVSRVAERTASGLVIQPIDEPTNPVRYSH